MELNTLSVDGGYTQTDVEEVAEALTGWTVDPITMNFTRDPATHDYINPITLDLGMVTPVTLPARDPGITTPANCEAAGQFVLGQLFNHPSTAEYICEKLAFILLSEEVETPGSIGRITAMWHCKQPALSL
jgi:uncharacterized protein (DUF1800 family)